MPLSLGVWAFSHSEFVQAIKNITFSLWPIFLPAIDTDFVLVSVIVNVMYFSRCL